MSPAEYVIFSNPPPIFKSGMEIVEGQTNIYPNDFGRILMCLFVIEASSNHSGWG